MSGYTLEPVCDTIITGLFRNVWPKSMKTPLSNYILFVGTSLLLAVIAFGPTQAISKTGEPKVSSFTKTLYVFFLQKIIVAPSSSSRMRYNRITATSPPAFC